MKNNNIVKIIKSGAVFFSIFFGVFLITTSFAADPAPLSMLKSTSGQMLSELNKSIGKLKGNDKLVCGLVNKILVPHFDLDSMSKAVVGTAWNKASSETKSQFMKEFVQYVARTYAAAMESYDGETVKFYPIRGGVVGDKVQIDSDLLLKSGPPIQMQYRLSMQGGRWLIYDFSVDGVSIVKNYNSQFTGPLRQGDLASLVKKLHENNARIN